VPAPPLLALSSEPQMRNTPMRFVRMRKRKCSGKLWITSRDISALPEMMTTAGELSISLIYSKQIDGSNAREGILQDFNGLFCLNPLGKPLKRFGAVTGNLTLGACR
jgi:hypothetical protein